MDPLESSGGDVAHPSSLLTNITFHETSSSSILYQSGPGIGSVSDVRATSTRLCREHLVECSEVPDVLLLRGTYHCAPALIVAQALVCPRSKGLDSVGMFDKRDTRPLPSVQVMTTCGTTLIGRLLKLLDPVGVLGRLQRSATHWWRFRGGTSIAASRVVGKPL